MPGGGGGGAGGTICHHGAARLGSLQGHANTSRPIQRGGGGAGGAGARSIAMHTLAASRAMLMRLDQSSCCAKAGAPLAFFSTSYSDPLAQNSVTMHGGSRHRPMNMTTFGWRRAAIMDTCSCDSK